MNNLKNFGYPKPFDNVRRKASSLYDTTTISTGTLEYNLFTNPSLSVYTRNRSLPLSGSEIFFIDEIALYLNLSDALTCTNPVLAFIRESYFQIFVDEREKIKIPLLECASFYTSMRNAEAYPPVVAYALGNERLWKRNRKLQSPIIINANSNVRVKLVTSSTNATAFNGITIKTYLNGTKLDKLTDFDYDFVKDNSLEKLSYSIYDVVTITTSEETIDCFSNRNKAEYLFNKSLPLSDKETFQVEAIECFGIGQSVKFLHETANEFRNFYLDIMVDDVKILETTNPNMFTVGNFMSKNWQDDGTNEHYLAWLNLSKGTYVLPEPIMIPANSKTSIKLRHSALTIVPAQNVLVDFKGTLTRLIA